MESSHQRWLKLDGVNLNTQEGQAVIKTIVRIGCGAMAPPGGEPLFSFFQRVSKYPILRGYLEPLPQEEEGEEPSMVKSKPTAISQEDVIILSDTESPVHPIVSDPPTVNLSKVKIEPSEKECESEISGSVLPVSLPCTDIVVYTGTPSVKSPPHKQTSIPQPIKETPDLLQKTFVSPPVPPSPLTEQVKEKEEQVKKKDKGKKKATAQETPAQRPASLSLQKKRLTRSQVAKTSAPQDEQASAKDKGKRKQDEPEPEQSPAAKKKRKGATLKSSPAKLPQYSPRFLKTDYEAKKDETFSRKVLGEKNLNLKQFDSVCQITQLLKKRNFINTVTQAKPYPETVVKEFYANLHETIDTQTHPRFHEAWLRGRWFKFSPNQIYDYFNLKEDESDPEDWIDSDFAEDYLASKLTNGVIPVFPKDGLPAVNLTSKFAILHKIALTNWLPGEHRGSLNFQMANLIYKIGTGEYVNLPDLMFGVIKSYVAESWEGKIKLPFPSLIFGILEKQGLRLQEYDQMITPKSRSVDRRLLDPPHHLDVAPIGQNLPSSTSTLVHPEAASFEANINTARLLKNLITEADKAIAVQMKRRNMDEALLNEVKAKIAEQVAARKASGGEVPAELSEEEEEWNEDSESETDEEEAD